MRAEIFRAMLLTMETGEFLGIAARIREARLRHSLNQSELGRLLGVEQRAVSRWERGFIANLTSPRLITMCTKLGLDANWLLGLPAAGE